MFVSYSLFLPFSIYPLSYYVGEQCCAKQELSTTGAVTQLIDLLPPSVQTKIIKTGLAIPNFRRGTIREKTVQDFLELVTYAATWLNPELPITPWQWLKNLKGNQIFDALRIFESMQKDLTNSQRGIVGLRMVANILGSHGDNKNCDVRSSLVALKSNSMDGEIVGLIGYPRRSVTRCESRIAVTMEVTEYMNSILEDDLHFSPGRRSINSFTMSEGTSTKRGLLFDSIVGLEGNLNPILFAQGVLYCTLLLQKKFDLDIIEVASVLQSFDYCAECSYYFIAATFYCLKSYEIDPTRRRSIGVDFGFDFQKMIYKVYAYEGGRGAAKHKRPYRQYSRYEKKETDCYLSRSEFHALVAQRLLLGMTCHILDPKLPEQNPQHKNDTAKTVYNKIFTRFNENSKKSGALTGGNTMIIWAMFGFFPQWLRTHRSPPKHDSPGMVSLKEKFGLQWDNDTESAPYLHSLQKARTAHVGYPIDMQCMDFIICKLGRVIRREEINKGNGSYLTYAVSGQPMFCSYQKETMIHDSQRYHLMIVQGDRPGKHLNRPVLPQSWTNKCGNGIAFLDIVTEREVLACLPKNYDGPAFNRISSRFFQSSKYHKVIEILKQTYPNTDDIHLPLPSRATMNQLTDRKFADLEKMNLDHHFL